jgi:hypothetical protein
VLPVPWCNESTPWRADLAVRGRIGIECHQSGERGGHEGTWYHTSGISQ